MAAPYWIKPAKITGKPIVHYPCPKCGEELTNPLARAGTSDECPACGVAHTVPALAEKQAADHKEAVAAVAQDQARRDREKAERDAIQSAQKHAGQVNAKMIAEAQWIGPSGALIALSVLALIAGVIVIVIAMNMDVSVLGEGFDRVVNLGQLNVRSNYIVLGSAFLCVSAILGVGASLVGCLGRWLKIVAARDVA